MQITDLKERQEIAHHTELNRLYNQLGNLLSELRKKSIPTHIILQINLQVEEMNESALTGDDLKKVVKQRQSTILKLVERELKIVPQNHYTNFWLVMGMSAFGLPIGVLLGLTIDNLGMMAIGLPIGMGIGTGLGVALDKGALAKGRQLGMEIK